MKLIVIIKKGNEVIKEESFSEGPISLGRSSDNDIVLDEPHISRHHVHINWVAGQFIVENLSQVRPLYFEGEKKQKIELNSGQTFEIPPFSIFVEAEEIEEFKETKKSTEPETDIHREEGFSILPSSFEEKIEEQTHIGEAQFIGLLEFLEGPASVQKVEVNKEEKLTIGRASTSTLVIEDEKLSRHHAQIVYENGQFFIEDLASGNGTYVNDKRVQKHALQSGDAIGIGDSKFRFRLVDRRYYHPRQEVSVRPQEELSLKWPGLPSEVVGLGAPQKKSKKALYLGISLALLIVVFLFWPEEKEKNGKAPASREVSEQKGISFESLSEEERAKVLDDVTEAVKQMNEGQFILAINILERLRLKVPDYERVNTLLAKAKQLFQERNIEESKERQHLQKAQGQAREAIAFEIAAAINYYRNHELKEALEAIDKAIEMDPQGEVYPEGIVQAKSLKEEFLKLHKEKSELVKHEEDFKKKIALVKKILNQASTYYREGDYAKAIASWEGVLKYKDPRLKEFTIQSRKNIEEASTQILNAYTAIIQGFDQEFETLFPVGRALAEVATPSQIADLRKKYASVLEKIPPVTAPLTAQRNAIVNKVTMLDRELDSHAQRQFYEALISEGQGDIDDAIRMWREIIATYSSNSEFVGKSQERLRKYRK